MEKLENACNTRNVMLESPQDPSFDLGISLTPALQQPLCAPQQPLCTEKIKEKMVESPTIYNTPRADEKCTPSTPMSVVMVKDLNNENMVDEHRKLPFKLRSHYWTKHNAELKNLTIKERMIADVTFMEASRTNPKNEIMYNDDETILTREQLHTLREGEIDIDIITAWCRKMNLINESRPEGHLKMAYLPPNVHMQVEPIEAYMKAFSPKKKQEHFNFDMDKELKNLNLAECELNKEMQIIDNRLLPKGVTKEDTYENYPDIVRDAFISHLKTKNDPLQKVVENFSNVRLLWNLLYEAYGNFSRRCKGMGCRIRK